MAVCPRNQVRSWSHPSWVTNGEILQRKTFASLFLKQGRGREEKNKQLQSFFITRKRNKSHALFVRQF